MSRVVHRSSRQRALQPFTARSFHADYESTACIPSSAFDCALEECDDPVYPFCNYPWDIAFNRLNQDKISKTVSVGFVNPDNFPKGTQFPNWMVYGWTYGQIIPFREHMYFYNSEGWIEHAGATVFDNTNSPYYPNVPLNQNSNGEKRDTMSQGEYLYIHNGEVWTEHFGSTIFDNTGSPYLPGVPLNQNSAGDEGDVRAGGMFLYYHTGSQWLQFACATIFDNSHRSITQDVPLNQDSPPC